MVNKMSYQSKMLAKYKDNWQSFELTLVLVTLDKYPELDSALRENKPKGEIVDLIIGLRAGGKQ